MSGIKTIFKKELADHFSSYRFIILFALISINRRGDTDSLPTGAG